MTIAEDIEQVRSVIEDDQWHFDNCADAIQALERIKNELRYRETALKGATLTVSSLERRLAGAEAMFQAAMRILVPLFAKQGDMSEEGARTCIRETLVDAVAREMAKKEAKP